MAPASFEEGRTPCNGTNPRGVAVPALGNVDIAVMLLRTENQSREKGTGLRSAGTANSQSGANPAAIQWMGEEAGFCVPKH